MKSILIVDDEPNVRAFLREVLQIEHYQVVEADSIATGRHELA